MIKFLITVDAEGPKKVANGTLHHLNYEEEIEIASKKIIKAADRYGARITFFLPLGELIQDYPQVVDLAKEMLVNHDVQMHWHLPVPLLSEEKIQSELQREMDLFEKYLNHRPVAIRAGVYNVGDNKKWIDSIVAAGLKIDSSVWPGANVVVSRDIKDVKIEKEEGRWGKGALYFDFRGAPIAGAYFPRKDDLTRMGDSQLLELVITMADYDEINPWDFKFDPNLQNIRQLKETFQTFRENHKEGKDLLLNMMWHSSYNLKKKIILGRKRYFSRPSLSRFSQFLKYLRYYEKREELKFIRIRDIDTQSVKPYVIYSREQSEYWLPKENKVITNKSNIDRLADILACPMCKGNAILDNNKVMCPKCKKEYPVVDGIPVMLRSCDRLNLGKSTSHNRDLGKPGQSLRKMLTKVFFLRMSYKIYQKMSENLSKFLVSLVILLLLIIFLPIAFVNKFKKQKPLKLRF